MNFIIDIINLSIVNELFNIFLIDFSFLLYNYILKINYSNTARWFLLHSIINMIVVYYSINDVITCIKYNNECYNIKWNDNSIKVYNYAFMLHIYHILFFKLTYDDMLHHSLMVGICGILCYKLQSILSSLALFFLSGLPGGIDYFLLYLVKKKLLKSLSEKNVYIIISAYIRSPGCILTTFIGMNGVFNNYNTGEYKKVFLLLLMLLLIFWNGQYYLLKSHESYVKKKFINNLNYYVNT
jgi:hypothetical protein